MSGSGRKFRFGPLLGHFRFTPKNGHRPTAPVAYRVERSPLMIAGGNIEAFVIFQYSNGVGHLSQCSTIARSLGSIAHVTMFSGGRPIKGYLPPAGVDFVQLPAIRWGTAADASAVPIDAGYTMAKTERIRSKLLVDHYLRLKPKIIVIEYFHFAPKRFGKTLDGLFDTIDREQESPIVICATRIYPMRRWEADADADAARINEQLRKHFSGVFHHADPKLFPLTSLGPYLQSALSGVRVWQTGFVRRPLAQTGGSDRSAKGLLLTIGGGGALGARLLVRWIKAAKAGSPDLLPVNAVCGPLMDVEDLKLVRAEQNENVTVHDWVANMDELIGSSRAVVCMGGGNTLVEALSLKKPVLAFPHDELPDQAFQVNTLHAHGMLLKGDPSLGESEMTALMNKLLRFAPQHPIDCDGADRSLEIIRQLLGARSNESFDRA
jgi:predicted glycosyltransferase